MKEGQDIEQREKLVYRPPRLLRLGGLVCGQGQQDCSNGDGAVDVSGG